MTDVEIDLNGPLFNGTAIIALRQCTEDIADEVSAQASANVHLMLDRSLRDPTPYYETQVTRDRIMPLTYLIHDRGVIYGPWLEGIGSRNRTTRFKGYASFRRAAQKTESEVDRIGNAVVRRYLPRMGG